MQAGDYAAEFARIGGEIERQWCRDAFHPHSFPGIAVEAAAMADALDLEQLLIAHYDRLDLSYRFSDFDLRIFENERFRIEILHWLGGSTSIHQHGFAGAFKLLAGRSLHVEYEFAVRDDTHPELRVGDLRLRRSEVLEPGAIRRIDAGNRFIHANFHMVRPTVTMVIRTHRDPHAGPQFDYHPPHFAEDPAFNEILRTKQRRLVAMLARTGRAELVDTAIDRIWQDATLPETLDILMLPAVSTDAARLERILLRTEERYPGVAAELRAAAHEEYRRQRGMRLFRQVARNDQRFLAALLLNLRDRRTILAHLKSEFPKEKPSEAAARLLIDMAVAGHLSPVSPDSREALAETIAAGSGRAPCPELEGLLAEDVLRPLFTPSRKARSPASPY